MLVKIMCGMARRAGTATKKLGGAQVGNDVGTLPESHSPELDLSPLERMKELENLLAEIGKPRTMLLARELLGVCVTILAHAYGDPESASAQGPVLEILRNVLDSLDCCESETKIGPGAPCLID